MIMQNENGCPSLAFSQDIISYRIFKQWTRHEEKRSRKVRLVTPV